MKFLGESPGGIIQLRIQEEYQWDPTVRLATVLTNTLGIPLLVSTVRLSVNFFLHLNKYTFTDGQGNINKVWNKGKL